MALILTSYATKSDKIYKFKNKWQYSEHGIQYIDRPRRGYMVHLRIETVQHPIWIHRRGKYTEDYVHTIIVVHIPCHSQKCVYKELKKNKLTKEIVHQVFRPWVERSKVWNAIVEQTWESPASPGCCLIIHRQDTGAWKHRLYKYTDLFSK